MKPVRKKEMENIITLTVDNEKFVSDIAATPAPLTARGTNQLKV